MMWILMWICTLLSVATAHPFESQFVGHKVHLTVEPDKISVQMLIEVPLPLVERSYQESGSATDKEAWLSGWMAEVQSDIQEHTWLDINGQRRAWSNVAHQSPMWRESSKFLVFDSQLTVTLSDPLQTMVLLDQILIAEPSVYWNDVEVDREILIMDTDQIEWQSNGRYTTHSKRWSMKESQREIRLLCDTEVLTVQLATLWEQYALGEPSLQSLKDAYLPRDWWREWKVGRTPWWLAVVSLGLALFCGSKGGRFSFVLAFILGILIGLLPVLPFVYRVGSIALLLMGTFDRRTRWGWCVAALMMVCRPSWFVWTFYVLGYFGHKMVSIKGNDKKT